MFSFNIPFLATANINATFFIGGILMLGGGNAELREGRLADVAPTLLELMGLPRPPEMTGVSLMHGVGAHANV